MSSGRYAAPLTIEPGRSRSLLLLISGVHLAALMVLIAFPIPGIVRFLAGLVVLASAVDVYRRHIGRTHGESVVSLRWDEHGVWTLVLADGRSVEAQLLPSSFWSVPLVILNFRCMDFRRRCAVPLFSDSLPEYLFRQLRVRLRLEAGNSEEQG